MRRPVISVHYYETYFFVSYVSNILRDQFSYIRRLNDFYGDGAQLALTSPFNRYSAFHCFLEFVIEEALIKDTEYCKLDILQDQAEQYKNIPIALNDMDFEVLPVERALRFHGLPHISFVEWLDKSGKTFQDARKGDVGEYIELLREEDSIDSLVEQAVKESFYILFGNRQLLLSFNEMISNQIQQTKLSGISEDEAEFFKKDGVLKRKNIPKWVKRAVFYRDRGLCCECRSDLTGKMNAWPEEQFDHMVPLAKGGLNDVTNIQLLCGSCNRRKSGNNSVTSAEYEDWYKMK